MTFPSRPGSLAHRVLIRHEERQLGGCANQNNTKEAKGKNQDPAQEERQASPGSSAPSMTSEVSDIEDKEYFHQDQLESIDASNGLVLGRFERAARRASPECSSSDDDSSSDEELDDELDDEFDADACEAALFRKGASQERETSENGSHDSDRIKSTEAPHSDDSSVTLDHEPGDRPARTILNQALSDTESPIREEARKRIGEAARKLTPQYLSREEALERLDEALRQLSRTPASYLSCEEALERLDEALRQLSGKPVSLNRNRYVQVKQTDAEAGEESSSQDSDVAEEDDSTPFDLELEMNGQAEQTEDEESDAEPGDDDGSQVSEASEEEDSTPSESDMGEQAEQTEDEDSDAESGEEDSDQGSGAAEKITLEDLLTGEFTGELTIPEYIEPEGSDDEQTGEDGSQVSEAAAEDGSQVSEAAEEDGSQASDAAKEDDPAPNDSSQSVSDDGDSDVVPLRSSTKRKSIEDIEDIELELKKSKLKREYRLKQVAIKHRYDVKDMELRHELSLRSSE